MKKVARMIGLLFVSFFAIFFMVSTVLTVMEGSFPLDTENLVAAILGVLLLISVLVAWFKVRTGVWLILGIGVLFSILGLIAGGSNRYFAALLGVIVFLSGLLILLGIPDKKNPTQK